MQVNRRPKPATQEPSGHKNNSQPVPIQVRTSKTRDHQRRQQQGSSSTTQDAPVPAPRHPKANQRPPHRAEKDNRYQDVGQADGHRQNEVKGQGHSGSSRDKSGSYSSKDDSKDAEELTVKYADSDVDDGVFGSSSSSSPRSDENSSSTRSASYSVRWIGSAPISAQLRGKQRSDMVIALTNKLSSAVENLGRVSFPFLAELCNCIASFAIAIRCCLSSSLCLQRECIVAKRLKLGSLSFH